MNTDMSKTNSCNGQWQEPDHFMTKIWFKKWKCYSKIFMRHDEAVADYNQVMGMLGKVPNIVINKSKTKVIEQDISTSRSCLLTKQYMVNVIWRTEA